MIRIYLTLAILLSTILLFAGCKQQQQAHDTPEMKEAPATEETTAEAPAEPDAEVLAALASADATDGAEDMVVSNCYGCSLHMPGNPEHAMNIGPYQVHLCSDNCQQAFQADPNKMILANATPMEAGEESEAMESEESEE